MGSEIFGGLESCGVGGPKKLLVAGDLSPRFCCLFFNHIKMPRVIADPTSRPGNKPAKTSPAVLTWSVSLGSIVTGTPVPVGLALAEVDGVESLVVEGDSAVEVGSAVGIADVVGDTLTVSLALAESLIRHKAPSSAHS